MNSTFKQFGIKEAYKQLEKRGDKLAPLQNLVDWQRFDTILYRRSGRGRPPYRPSLMMKILVLQHLYGISDEEVTLLHELIESSKYMNGSCVSNTLIARELDRRFHEGRSVRTALSVRNRRRYEQEKSLKGKK